ncbi:hypothetical protein QQ045_013874 [Rhodiola kirilowii]
MVQIVCNCRAKGLNINGSARGGNAKGWNKAWYEDNFKLISAPYGEYLRMEERHVQIVGVGRTRIQERLNIIHNSTGAQSEGSVGTNSGQYSQTPPDMEEQNRVMESRACLVRKGHRQGEVSRLCKSLRKKGTSKDGLDKALVDPGDYQKDENIETRAEDSEDSWVYRVRKGDLNKVNERKDSESQEEIRIEGTKKKHKKENDKA